MYVVHLTDELTALLGARCCTLRVLTVESPWRALLSAVITLTLGILGR